MLNIIAPSQQETEAISYTSHGHGAHCVHIKLTCFPSAYSSFLFLLCVTRKARRREREARCSSKDNTSSCLLPPNSITTCNSKTRIFMLKICRRQKNTALCPGAGQHPRISVAKPILCTMMHIRGSSPSDIKVKVP